MMKEDFDAVIHDNIAMANANKNRNNNNDNINILKADDMHMERNNDYSEYNERESARVNALADKINRVNIDKRRPYNVERFDRMRQQQQQQQNHQYNEGHEMFDEPKGKAAENMIDPSNIIAAGIGANKQHDDNDVSNFLKDANHKSDAFVRDNAPNANGGVPAELRTAGARPQHQPVRPGTGGRHTTSYSNSQSSAAAPFANYNNVEQFQTCSHREQSSVRNHNYEPPQFARRRAPDLQITGPSLRNPGANSRRPQSARYATNHDIFICTILIDHTHWY